MFAVNTFLDDFKIFSFELMHWLAIWLLIKFKERLENYLSDPDRTTATIQSRSRPTKQIRITKWTVPNLMSDFLKFTERRSYTSGLRIVFCEGEVVEMVSGFFTKTGTWDARGIRWKENWSYICIFGVIVDVCSGNPKTDQRADTLFVYVDLGDKILKEIGDSWRSFLLVLF